MDCPLSIPIPRQGRGHGRSRPVPHSEELKTYGVWVIIELTVLLISLSANRQCVHKPYRKRILILRRWPRHYYWVGARVSASLQTCYHTIWGSGTRADFNSSGTELSRIIFNSLRVFRPSLIHCFMETTTMVQTLGNKAS